jgi:hypothetical protein
MTSPFTLYHDLLERALGEARASVFGEGDQIERLGLTKYATDPVGFAVDALGHKQWEAQKYILRALVQHRYVALNSCRSASKTWTASEAVLAFTCTAPTICVTVAPTWTQVEKLMWGPISESHAMAVTKLPGRCLTTELKIGPRWYAMGLSTDNPDNIQGIHSGRTLLRDSEEEPKDTDLEDAALDMAERALFEARKRPSHRLLLILDECPGIRARLLETLAGSFADENVFVLAQGNPTLAPDADHPYARWIKPGSRFHRVHIAYAPFPAEWEPEPADKCFHTVPAEINKGICEALVKEHGLESARARCHAFGLPAALDLERQFITLALLVQQDANILKVDQRAEATHIGWDIAASEEGDWNVLSIWKNGLKVAELKWRGEDLEASCDIVIEAIHKYGHEGHPVPARNVHIDATGVGKGPVSTLRRKGYYIDAVDVGASARGEWKKLTGQVEFANRKAELVYVLRRAMQEGLARIPRKYAESWRQAQWQTYKDVVRAGGTAVAVAESKQDLHKKYGRSPDEFDADCLAWSRGHVRPVIMSVDSLKKLRRLQR